MDAMCWLVDNLLRPLPAIAFGAIALAFFQRLFYSIPDLILRVAARRFNVNERANAYEKWRRILDDKRKKATLSPIPGLGFALECLIWTFRAHGRHSRARG